MFTYLRDHAVKNVWCSPEQDNQIIVSAQRITKPGGELVSFPIMTSRIALPKKDRRFHVYQIGQAHPSILGLLPKSPTWAIQEWKPFSQAVENLPLFCELYTDDGARIALNRSYYMYTNQRALIFAVDVSGTTWSDYDVDQVYLRLYTNAFYEADESNLLTDNTRCEGGQIYQISDILHYQARVSYFRNKADGQTLCFVNGVHVDTIDLITTQVGDEVELVYDASIKRVVELTVSSLNTFQSVLDSEYKYLIHYPLTGSNVIDFCDDLDVYVVKKEGVRFKARIYHKNRSNAVRMVTHRDYSVSVSQFRHIAERFSEEVLGEVFDLGAMTLRFYIRNSGLTRPLVFDHNRIFELYKLPDAEILRAMVGVNSLVPEWQAAALENSAYVKLMRSAFNEIDSTLIEEAYGYNAIAKIIGDGPIAVRTPSQGRYAPLPMGAYEKSTVFEYDVEGRLLGFNHHPIGTNYYPLYLETTQIEAIVGLGAKTSSVWVGQDDLPIPSKFSYRVYACYLVDGLVNNAWRDITGSELYTVENGRLVWQNLETDQWLMVRSDEKFLAYGIALSHTDGLLYFDLSEVISGEENALRVPMGDLDIWLNGRALIRDLDYTVEMPRVHIFNKQYLAQPALSTEQRVTVRFTGFASKDLKLKDAEDYGFVEHGVLSNNQRFDVRDDKVLRITVDGLLKSREALKFSESTLGVSVINALNGAPYQIKDVVVPLRGYTDDETYALRAKSEVVDKRVEDYLSVLLPEPTRNAVSAIADRHVLFSPFISHWVSILTSGEFNKTQIEKELTEMEVLELCQPFEYLLKNDPLNEALKLQYGYVVIHPTLENTHTSVDLYTYRFIKQVVTLYGRGHVNLSTHLVINLGG